MWLVGHVSRSALLLVDDFRPPGDGWPVGRPGPSVMESYRALPIDEHTIVSNRSDVIFRRRFHGPGTKL